MERQSSFHSDCHSYHKQGVILNINSFLIFPVDKEVLDQGTVDLESGEEFAFRVTDVNVCVLTCWKELPRA